MSSIMKELKNEISRLARREINKELAPVKRVNAAQRGLIADLRRQITALQRELGGLRKAVPAVGAPVAAKPDEPGKRFWITARGVRKLRGRLGLTQAQFGKLAGVSGQTIVNWEGSKGKIDVRKKVTIAKLQELRKMGKRDVMKLFAKEAPAKAAKPRKTRKPGRPRKAKKPVKPAKAKQPAKAKKAVKARKPRKAKAVKAAAAAPKAE